MEASAYAWMIIVIFFLVYAMIQLRKCFIQLMLSRGDNLSRLDQFSTDSVYTIESASGVTEFRTEQEVLDSMNKIRDDSNLPTYEQVIALDRQNRNTAVSNTSVGTSASTLSDMISTSRANNS